MYKKNRMQNGKNWKSNDRECQMEDTENEVPQEIPKWKSKRAQKI